MSKKDNIQKPETNNNITSPGKSPDESRVVTLVSNREKAINDQSKLQYSDKAEPTRSSGSGDTMIKTDGKHYFDSPLAQLTSAIRQDSSMDREIECFFKEDAAMVSVNKVLHGKPSPFNSRRSPTCQVRVSPSGQIRDFDGKLYSDKEEPQALTVLKSTR